VPSHTVEPGARLVDRYRLEERISGLGDTSYWRATDETLSRTVGIRTLPAGHEHGGEMLAAARAAARTLDPRFLRVLDASAADHVVYVVHEWVQARSLRSLLREGPLEPAEAARIVGQVAAALASAHETGLVHLCLEPRNILVTDTRQVKVVGLAVEAAMRGVDEREEAVLRDVRGCGSLLYAALTARWPAGPLGELAAAPEEHGRPCTPGQVRAGVPAELDLATIRALDAPRPVEGVGLHTAAALGAALASTQWAARGHSRGRQDRYGAGWNVGGGRDPREDDGWRAHREPTRTMAAPVPAARSPRTGDRGSDRARDRARDQARPPPPRAGTATRTLWWVAGAVLVLGLALVGWQLARAALVPPPSQVAPGDGQSPVGEDSGDDDGSEDEQPQPQDEQTSPSEVDEATQGEMIEIVDVADFDPPPGNGEEHPEDVGNAVDGDPATVWSTLTYFNDPELGNLKEGVGLVLDLGETQPVSAVTLDLVGAGTTIELRAAEQLGQTAADFDLVASAEEAGESVTLEPVEPVQARYLLLWLTRLPPVGGDEYSAEVAEVVVRG
jgi:putative peptidoglycan lipid II flippase